MFAFSIDLNESLSIFVLCVCSLWRSLILCFLCPILQFRRFWNHGHDYLVLYLVLGPIVFLSWKMENALFTM